MSSILTMSHARPLPLVRYSYYTFVFSIPIETLDIGIQSGLLSLSKLAGIIFIATALVQPRVCFKKPPRAFWYFAGYILVCLLLAAFQPAMLMGPAITRVLTLLLLLTLFWVSYNLFQDQDIVKGAFLTLVLTCALLAILILSGAGNAIAQGRVTAVSQNANVLAATLALGMLTLLGLAYGRAHYDGKAVILLWICFGILAVGIISTGSRGPMIGLLIGIVFFMTRSGALKLHVFLIALLAISVLIWASYENDAVRLRWEKVFTEGNLSRREAIIPEAWKMFTERPLVGWGPVSHYVELGARFERSILDPHSTYLWVLTETGLLGAIPFFIGLALCLRAAWASQDGAEGSLPIALLMCLLIASLSGTMHNRKLFWIVLAYSLASESFLSARWRQVVYPVDPIENTPQPVGYGLHVR